jgi:tight adherence protein B
MTLTANFLPLLTFLAVVTAVAGVYSTLSDLFLRDWSRVSHRVDVEFLKRQRDRTRKLSLFKDPGQFVVEASAHDQCDSSLRVRFEMMIEQSGLDLTPGRLLARAAAVGLAVGILAGLFGRSPLAAILAMPIGAAAPVLYVRRIRDARLDKLLGQLPEAFELMSRVVRAGQTIPQALQAVSAEFQPPLASEFAFCYEQQNLGLTTEAALRDLGRRTGLLEIKIFVLALIVQQQTGGNLAELLDKLSTVIRERFQIRGQIRTLTAEGRSQATVLLILPLLMFGFILLFNRDYANMLLARPKLVVGCLVSEAIGALWIRRITNFDF